MRYVYTVKKINSADKSNRNLLMIKNIEKNKFAYFTWNNIRSKKKVWIKLF